MMILTINIALIVTMGVLIYFGAFGKKIRNLPPSIPIPSAIFYLCAFWHPNLGDFFVKIGRKYGSILHVGFGPLNMVLLNGTEEVREACRHPQLNGRMDCMYKEAIGNKGILWADETSQKRKFIFRNTRHFNLDGKSTQNYVHEEISLLFKHFDGYGGKPQSVRHIFNIPALNGVVQIFLGEKLSHDDPALKDLVHRLGIISEVPNNIMRACVFSPPLAKWLPGFLSGWNFVKKTVTDGKGFYEPHLIRHSITRIPNQPRDLVDALADEVDRTTDPESVFHSSQNTIGPILFDIFSAAIETSNALLEWIILYLSHYPQVQKKLQAEVDRVVGMKRLPALADRPHLHYVQAFLQEMFRIAPVVPFGYHMAVEDTTFRGYTIPKGTTILSNFYGIHKDPQIWEDPEVLKPERFIDKAGNFVKSDQLFTFGFGRRSCVGEITAKDQLFLYITRIVQSYTLIPEKKLKEFRGTYGMGYHCSDFRTIFYKRNNC